MKKLKEFNGYAFSDKETRKRMKYIVIFNGDLDLNGAYGFRNKSALKRYLNSYEDYYTRSDRIEAIFSVKSIEKPIK